MCTRGKAQLPRLGKSQLRSSSRVTYIPFSRFKTIKTIKVIKVVVETYNCRSFPFTRQKITSHHKRFRQYSADPTLYFVSCLLSSYLTISFLLRYLPWPSNNKACLQHNDMSLIKQVKFMLDNGYKSWIPPRIGKQVW